MSAPVPDIRDIRAPYLIAQDWRLTVLLAVGAALLMCLIYWLWRTLRARRPQATLLQRTLQRLEGARVLMQAGDALGFSVAVSDIVRAYIEQRFAVRATQRTTGEFLHECVSLIGSALQAHEQLLGEFLGFCDLAKFARWSFDTQQMEGMLNSARQFVEATAAPVPAQTLTGAEAVDVPIRQP